MRKKILLVESSDAIRSVAENLLRQNGYEVIGLTDPEKAMELIGFTRPDLIIAGSDLSCSDNQPFHETLQADHRSNNIPLMLITEQGDESLPFPPEILVSKPLDPKDFLGKVSVFAGANNAPAKSNPSPLHESSLDDEFLDAALGLDRIDVVESEILDKTRITSKRVRRTDEDDIGLGHKGEEETDDTNSSESGRVESLMIKEDSTDIVRNDNKSKVTDVNASGKLDILDDQFGMVDPNNLNQTGGTSGHDYDWFINEMQRDVQSGNAPATSGKSAKKAQEDSGKLVIDENSSFVDPITPPPGAKKAGKAEGVEKFIDEFKREVEKFHDDESIDQFVESKQIKAEVSGGRSGSSLATAVASVNSEEITLFTRQLAYDLAEKIATKIVGKLDGDKLLELIKREIVAEARRQSNRD